MKKQILTLIILVLPLLGFGQEDCIPGRPAKQRLINDFASVFNPQEANQLERRLVNFNDTTSTQIAIVTVADLCDYEPSDFAYEIGEQWGVGNKKFNNGVVILLKPKTADSKGQAFIAVGYGLEGALPDVIAKRIVENEMIPQFKKNDYFGGIEAAAQVIMDITGGEYSADNYNKKRKGGDSIPIVPFIFILFFILIMIAGTIGRARRYAHRNDMSLLAALFLMGSMNRRHKGYFDDFSSGGGGFGGFGGGGGGFGGFGGGSFGGGGAGGSW